MKRLWLLLLLAGLLAAAAGLWSRWLLHPREAAQAPETAEPAVVVEDRDVLLYYATSDGLALASFSAKIAGCEQEVDCMQNLLGRLAEGPGAAGGDLTPVLPAGTRVLGVAVDGDLAEVDFTRTLLDAHPGGSRSELLTVYGIADTLAVNFPWLRQVRIKVEGNPVDTIKGHVDLRLPVVPDFRLVRRQGEGTGADAG